MPSRVRVAIKLSSCLNVALPVCIVVVEGGGGKLTGREGARCDVVCRGDGSVVKHKPRCTLIENGLNLLTFFDRDDLCHLKLRASLQDDSAVWNCIWQTCHFYHCNVNSNFILCVFG